MQGFAPASFSWFFFPYSGQPTDPSTGDENFLVLSGMLTDARWRHVLLRDSHTNSLCWLIKGENLQKTAPPSSPHTHTHTHTHTRQRPQSSHQLRAALKRPQSSHQLRAALIEAAAWSQMAHHRKKFLAHGKEAGAEGSRQICSHIHMKPIPGYSQNEVEEEQRWERTGMSPDLVIIAKVTSLTHTG